MEVIFQVVGTLTSNINLLKHSWRTNGWAQLLIFLVKFSIMSRLGMKSPFLFDWNKHCVELSWPVFNIFLVHFSSPPYYFLSLQGLIVSGTTISWDALVVWGIRIGNHQWGLFVIRNERGCGQDRRSESWVMKMTNFQGKKCESTRSTSCIQNLEAWFFNGRTASAMEILFTKVGFLCRVHSC